MNIGLVWATNVGKSTLFNRLIGQFRAIVTDVEGTTTDILRHPMQVPELGSVTFLDSPGLLEFENEWPYIQYIIDTSDIILFVIDDEVWMTAKENHIIDYIRKSNKQKNTILVINKLDIEWRTQEYWSAIADYYTLWLSIVVWISALKEHNVEMLQEAIVSLAEDINIQITPEAEIEGELYQIAIVGKPNAGKSTLLNQLVGETLSKVEDKPGTTRDYVTANFVRKDTTYRLFDTAGIKRKWHMRWIEKIAYTKTKEMLAYLRPVALFIIDATEGITHRDMSLIQEINNIALPIIICLNKMDLLDRQEKKYIMKQTQAKLDFAPYIPIMPLVAQKGTGVDAILSMVKDISQEAQKRIGTNELNKAIMTDSIQKPARFPKNKICKIMYATQIDIDAPTFVFFVNYKERANFAFKRRCENVLRRHFGFVWTPIVIRFKWREQKPKDME